MKNLFFSTCVLLAGTLVAQPFQPVNKNASPEAKKLLAFVYSISGKYLLTGQHNYNE